ncbi:hypothetical protein XELAEV_18003446mg [Xenopus laevis]|nr:hypothetical protein XELAEV_18003446mg [Xenopus laevis]
MLGGMPIIKILVCLTVMCVGHCRSVSPIIQPACHLEIIKTAEEYEYIQEGDIMIGGVITVSMFEPEDYFTGLTCNYPSVQNYKYLVDFLFVIEQVNENPYIFPNTTLGYRIYDSCGDPRKAIKSILQILSGSREPVPNYSWVGKGTLAGFIGDLTSETTVPIAQILSVFGYTQRIPRGLRIKNQPALLKDKAEYLEKWQFILNKARLDLIFLTLQYLQPEINKTSKEMTKALYLQISYGATDPVLSDRFNFPYFFRTTGSDDTYYFVISKIMKYFQWNWVGIILFDDERGERDLQLLKYYLSIENICIDFTLKIISRNQGNIGYGEIIRKSTTNIIIFCGAVNLQIALHFTFLHDLIDEKKFILTSSWLHYNHLLDFSHKVFHGSLILMQNKEGYLSNYQYAQFSKGFHPSRYPDDKLLENIWLLENFCFAKNHKKKATWHIHNCSEQESISRHHLYDRGFHTLNMIFAVDLFDRALYYMDNLPGIKNKIHNYRYKIHHYLRTIRYLDSTNHFISFNENGEFVTQYLIINLYLNLGQQSAWKKCGTYTPWAPAHQQLNITPGEIQWKTKGNKKISKTPSFQTPNQLFADQCFVQ